MKQLRYYQDKVGNIYELTTDLEKHLSLEIAQLNIKLKNIQDDNNKQKEVLDKIKEIVDKAPCLWCVDEEFERVGGTIELSYKEYTGWKDILELLEEIE